MKHYHGQPLFQTHHWLQIQARTDYKLWIICHNFFCLFLCDLLAVYTSSKQFHSSADTWILHIPNVKTKTLPLVLFFLFFFSLYCAPEQSNSHPSDIRHIQSSHAFKTALKTCLYKQKQYTSDFKFCLLSFERRLSTVTESVIVNDTTCCLSNMSSAGYYHRADPSYNIIIEKKKEKSCHWKGL